MGVKGTKWGVRDEVLAVLGKADRALSTPEIAAMTGRNINAVLSWLKAEESSGRVIRSGSSTAFRWRLAPQGPG